MDKLNISKQSSFSQLPLAEFDKKPFSIYVLDFKWNYLFVNDFVKRNLGERSDVIGKNMWQEFRELAKDVNFAQLKFNAEHGLETNFVTISPINLQRLHVIGYPLQDCYLFSSSILPEKELLIDELRKELKALSHH